jgi:hypothetical protein
VFVVSLSAGPSQPITHSHDQWTGRETTKITKDTKLHVGFPSLPLAFVLLIGEIFARRKENESAEGPLAGETLMKSGDETSFGTLIRANQH